MKNQLNSIFWRKSFFFFIKSSSIIIIIIVNINIVLI